MVRKLWALKIIEVCILIFCLFVTWYRFLPDITTTYSCCRFLLDLSLASSTPTCCTFSLNLYEFPVKEFDPLRIMCNKDPCRSTLSAVMSTDSRPTFRPTVDRHVDRLSADTVRCHPPVFTATRPILQQYSASTTLILSVLDTEFQLLYSTVK